MTLPTLSTKLSTLLKVGALTFAGAFLAALCTSTVPTTLEEWKRLILPALGTAVAAELVFLRGQVASILASNVLTTTVDTAVEKILP